MKTKTVSTISEGLEIVRENKGGPITVFVDAEIITPWWKKLLRAKKKKRSGVATMSNNTVPSIIIRKNE